MSGESSARDKFDLVARNVRRLLRDRGYSLSELARRAGLAKQTLSAIEGGQANPTVLTLTTIATALGVPVAHLLTEYGSPVLVRRRTTLSGTRAPTGARGNSTRSTGSVTCGARSSGTPGRVMRRSSTRPTGPARCTT